MVCKIQRMMKDSNIHDIIRILQKEVRKWETPAVTKVAEKTRDPFKVLISCILSLRTIDSTTAEAGRRLFSLAESPDEMLKIPVEKIESAIFAVGFYRTKAKNIIEICKAL